MECECCHLAPRVTYVVVEDLSKLRPLESLQLHADDEIHLLTLFRMYLGIPSTQQTPFPGLPWLDPLTKRKKLETDVRAYVDSIVRYLPATEDRLEDFRSQQQQHEITRQLIAYCSEGWPDKSQLPGPLKVYWRERSDLTVHHGLLMKRN